ncbi:MAG: hypothetical protein U5K29_04470 [Acidimicrobiales bacterium]|nr:hypothetical protein [Acidimicrobiales bacterium]
MILLDRIDHIDEAYYNEAAHRCWRSLASCRATAKALKLIRGSDLTDGERSSRTGAGSMWEPDRRALLEATETERRAVAAVEPHREFQAPLSRVTRCTPLSADVAPELVDVVTLFHVFEHFKDPLGDLQRLRRTLVPGGGG